MANWQKNLKPAAVKKKYTCPRQAERQRGREREAERPQWGNSLRGSQIFNMCSKRAQPTKGGTQIMIAFFFFSTTRKIEDVVKPETERERERRRKRMRQRVCEV